MGTINLGELQGAGIREGGIYEHVEPRETPHRHIALYVAVRTDSGEKVVVHRPTHKTDVIYCEPVEDFSRRFKPAAAGRQVRGTA